MTAQQISSPTSTVFTVEDVPASSSSSPAGSASAVDRAGGSHSIRRFFSLALHPVPGTSGAMTGIFTAALAAGVWAAMTWGVIPASKQIRVQTPIGAQTHTVAIARWPSSAAIALALLALLFAVAGVRTARELQRLEAAGMEA
jgi:hypothetical protein